MPYPIYPSPSCTDWICLFKYVNDYACYYQAGVAVQCGFFGLMVLLAIGIISFVSLKMYRNEAAFVTTAFITLISSLFLAAINLIDSRIILATSVIFFVSVLLLWKQEN